MPVHDWRRVSADVFHDFHLSWAVSLSRALNNGVLPSECYALLERVAGGFPGRLSGQEGEPVQDTWPPLVPGGADAAQVPPRSRFTATAELDWYARKRNAVVIRHSSEDCIVALIEILSPSNKNSRHGIRTFLDKVVNVLMRGIHLLLIDLHPPGPRDPHGIHGALWEEISDVRFELPRDKPLTLASYCAGQPVRGYIEPVAVGDALPDRPLFLEPDGHVWVPLEATYEAAWRGIPQRWRRVLERDAS